MTIEVRAPSGDTIRFPDGTDEATILGVMRREYGGPEQQPPAATAQTYRPAAGPAERPQPLGRIDRSNEVEGVYIDNEGQERVVNPSTDMVGDDGMVYPRQANRPGDVVNRSTLLPFVETLGPEGQRIPGIGLPEAITGPIDRANRLLTEPPQLGANAEAAGDAGVVGATISPFGRGVAMFPERMASRPAAAAAEPAARAATEAAEDVPGTALGVRPHTAPATDAARAAELAGELGVDLPRAAAGSRTQQIMGGSIKELPWIGDPIVEAAGRATRQIESRVTGVADELGPSSREGAGLGFRDDMATWMRDGSRQTTREAYQAIDAVIDPSFTVPLSRTDIAVREMLARDKASAVSDGAQAAALVRPALARRGGLTYDGVKGLRTSIIDRLDGKIGNHSISQQHLQRLKTALDDDVRHAVRRAGVAGKGGKRALELFEEANTLARTQAAKRDSLTKIVGLKGDAAGEAIVDRIRSMAGAKRGADISRVRMAKAAVGEEAWNDVAAAILRNMGQNKDGWSLARWRTEFTGLSDEGRAALFGSGPGSHGETLSKIAELGAFGERLERIGNPSQSARMGAIVALPTAAIAAPFATLTTIFGGRALANALARPVTAKQVARVATAVEAHAKAPSNGREQILVQAVRSLAASLGEDETEAEQRLRTTLAQAPADNTSRPETFEKALALPKGTRFIDPNGVARVR